MFCDLVNYLRGQRILIWGLGVEGLSSVNFLQKHLPGQSFAVADSDPSRIAAIQGRTGSVEAITEEGVRNAGERYDLILKSPGISLGKYGGSQALREKTRGQADLFLQFAPGQVIGVTGTKGKSTTSSLITHILGVNGWEVPLVGNIGVPPLEVIQGLDQDSHCVVELSSYQLEASRHSPRVAVLLNLYQEHLNYHGNLEAYWAAKWNITEHQQSGDTLIYNGLSPDICSRLGAVPFGVSKISFGLDEGDSFPQNGSVALRGAHNRLNALAAAKVAGLLGVTPEIIQEGLESFRGLPHRLEPVGTFAGVSYYNDSISTVPESALAALSALPETTSIILGGQNRGVDYGKLTEALRVSSLSTIILVSETGEVLRDLLKADTRVCWVSHLTEAVAIARQQTPAGGTCLFSPAAPSYNQFRNFEERGSLFKSLVSGV